ncbi:MAG TPA: J domain-containing protein [Thermoanaerobaculia bacterium]|nr:J domain-containing protein [Thermoanaerobaculia bacterium]
MEYKDYYASLGVSKDASQDDIQKAYRKLARKFHPDVNKDPGAENRFKEIGEAYEVLKDPEKRQKYDQFGSAWRVRQQTGAPPPGWENIRWDFGEGGDFDLGGSGFSSFFENLFGGAAAGPGGRGRPGGTRVRWSTGARPGAGAGGGAWSQPGTDTEARLPVTLEEAVRGGSREITLSDAQTGERNTLAVKIPAGVRAGQRIRLAGKGQPGLGGGQPGDLFLRVELEPHPRFRVEDGDLFVTVPVTPWEAALGGEAEVETLQGPLRVRIPPGSSSGRRIRLRGKGLPKPGGEPGDLYAEIRIVVPETLSERERELYQELAQAASVPPRG